MLAARYDNVDVVRYLVDAGADKEAKRTDGKTVLMWAACKDNVDMVRYLVDAGADKEAKDTHGWTALMLAATYGHPDMVRCLVDAGADKEAKDTDGQPALMLAARHGKLDVVRYLVDAGADKEAKDTDGETALIYSARYDNVDVVRYLIDAGADKEAKRTDGWTALMLAARYGCLHVVRYLVDAGADKEAKNTDGWSALMLVALDGRLAVVRYLVDAGADKEAKDTRGWTALMLAATYGHPDMVRCLVDAGADKEAKSTDGKTALMWAVCKDNVDMVRYLVDAGADKEAKDTDGKTALMWAAHCGHLDVVRYLVNAGVDKEAKDTVGWTALMWAIHCGHLDMVRCLVDAGVDKEAKNTQGRTALMLAAIYVHPDMVRCLVDAGADASWHDNEGNSALIYLLLRDDAKDDDVFLPVVKLLLEHEAPPIRSNNQGESAKSIALIKHFPQISVLIEEYAAKPRRPAVMRREPEGEDPGWFISSDTVTRRPIPLAVGGSGKVYRATWSHNDVVMKEIAVELEDHMRRFRREVEIWRGLSHPNVVHLFGANDRAEPCFIVSEFATNGELISYLKREKDQGRNVAWRKLREVGAGLSYLHGKGIVHGDLRGNNIVVSDAGKAKLTDFGLSFFEAGPCSVMRMKDRLGAMAWRAPEFANMTVMTPTYKSDVYSLGMCIIEAVTCKTPWSGYTDDEIRGCLRRGEIMVERPEELTDTQWELMGRMIAKNCDDRPEMLEVLRSLKEFALHEEEDEEFGS
ncbi:hypothetical protein BBJ28_00024585 [Nothophytophthora sp. Chile5]|nr:hypothetical protein BBJ28_00024585 [Nothophytophthora sp. Chile5]